MSYYSWPTIEELEKGEEDDTMLVEEGKRIFIALNALFNGIGVPIQIP